MGFLQRWRHQNETEKAEHSRQLQVIKNEQQTLITQQIVSLKEAEIALGHKFADLKIKVDNHTFDVNLKSFNLTKAKDDLARQQAEFNLQLDKKRQDMDLEREGFFMEQNRLNRKMDNEFQIRMTELQMKKYELDQQHVQKMATIEAQVEIQKLQRIQLQETNTQKTLEALQRYRELESNFGHTEKMRQLDYNIKRQEAEMALIKTLSTDMQETAYHNLRTKMLNGLQSVHQANNDHYSQEY